MSKDINELLEDTLVEVRKAKEMLRILFEEEVTDEEAEAWEEELKGSLDNNIYQKEGQQ